MVQAKPPTDAVIISRCARVATAKRNARVDGRTCEPRCPVRVVVMHGYSPHLRTTIGRLHMKLHATCLAAGLLAPLAAQAQPISGVYVGLGAGVNFLQDEQARFSGVAASGIGPSATSLRFDPGFRTMASVGYGLGNGVRLEIEGDYFRNTLSSVGQIGGNAERPASAQGAEEKYGGFVNAIYDVDPTLFGFGALPFGITPYLGAGIGYLRSHNQGLRISSPDQLLIRSTGADGNVAYQAIVGLAVPIDAIPGLALTAEYRFTGVAANRVSPAQYFAPGIAGRTQFTERDNFNHSIVAFAVRYAFSYPPPASPVPVAPPTSPVQPVRTYIVFFDWDRADLSDRARQIVAAAATAANEVHTTRIEVQGNADRSGTPPYNQRLSLRRARVVAGELVRDGVPQDEIAIEGFGETRPLVATLAGVREPQNRRVEIILR
ncbi:OmpA family protein [Lichenicoccus sp.]|uniref:OmpA family protein n=1 Tax=Lichenicoccus sp. TaxID=2781899 RepID=UPI003D126214